MHSALRHTEVGRPVLPLHDGTKGPRITDWPNKATTDEATVREWFERWPDANIGALTGEGVVILDVDPRNGGMETFRALTRLRGDLPVGPCAKTAGGGFHYAFRVEGEFRKRKVGPGLELLGDGQFVVVASSRVGEGSYSGFLFDMDRIPALPEWLHHPASDNGSAVEKRTTKSGVSPVETLQHRPVNGERNEWLTRVCGHYARIYSDDEALYRFHVDRAVEPVIGDDFDDKEAAATVASIWKAEQRKPKDTTSDDDRIRRQERVRLEVRDGYRQERQEEEAKTAVQGLPEGETLASMATRTWPEVRYAIEGLALVGDKVFMPGQQGSGKSTTGANLTRSLADGVPLFGRFDVTPTKGNVGLLQFEMSDRTQYEYLAACGIRNTQRVFIRSLVGYRMMIQTEAFQEEMIQWLRRYEISRLVIDPFRHLHGGLDENDNSQMSPVLTALDLVRKEGGVTQELFTSIHAGHDGSRIRGASVLQDWPDAMWMFERDPATGTRYFKLTKIRDPYVDPKDWPQGSLLKTPGSGLLTFAEGDSKENDKYMSCLLIVRTELEQNPGIKTRELRAALKGGPGKKGRLDTKLLKEVIENEGYHEHSIVPGKPTAKGVAHYLSEEVCELCRKG